MQRYEVKEGLGSGNFGTVFRATNKSSGHEVAIKRMKVDFTTWQQVVTSRELHALQILSHHPNIVKLFEVIREQDDRFYLVFECMEGGNLLDFIRKHARACRTRHLITLPHPMLSLKIKSITKQVLLGLSHMHEMRIVHRDLKPENILLRGEVCKVADLGLAREASSPPFTEYVSTRWYRAPEVLLRMPYGTPVDMFALGCIMAEMYNLQPLFPGDTEIDQICQIISVLGVPSPQTWPEGLHAARRMSLSFSTTNLPGNYPDARNPLEKVVRSATSSAASLIRDLLILNPSMRTTAGDAVRHQYFEEFDERCESNTLMTPSRTSTDIPPQPVSISPGHKDTVLNARHVF